MKRLLVCFALVLAAVLGMAQTTQPPLKSPSLSAPSMRSAGALENGGYASLIASIPGLVAHWPLDDGGTTLRDIGPTRYNGTWAGVTLGQPGIGDGVSCAYFDGTGTDVGNIYSASLANAFPTTRGTIAVWLKVDSAAVWTDGAERFILRFRADASNDIAIRRSTAANVLSYDHTAGGTADTVTYTTSGAPTGWIFAALTWYKAGDATNAYYQGVRIGGASTLGTWNGTGLDSTRTAIGSGRTSGTSPWYGWGAHGLLYNRDLTAAEVWKLYNFRSAELFEFDLLDWLNPRRLWKAA